MSVIKYEIWTVEQWDTLPSSNSVAISRAKAGEQLDYNVIWPLVQTQGRGKGDRVWYSDTHDLTFTLCIPSKFSAHWINIYATVITALLIQGYKKPMLTENNAVSIKWPNDILLNNKKVSGILVEQTQYIFVGIGINTCSHPANILSTSLGMAHNERMYFLYEFLHLWDSHMAWLQCTDDLVSQWNTLVWQGLCIFVNPLKARYKGHLSHMDGAGQVYFKTEGKESVLLVSGDVVPYESYKKFTKK